MDIELTHTLTPQMVDLTGLPESEAQYVRGLVDKLRQKYHVPTTQNGILDAPVESFGLLKWPGTVIGTLRREDMYDDVC